MFPFFNAAEEIFQSSLLCSSKKYIQMAGRMAKILSALAWGMRQAANSPLHTWSSNFFQCRCRDFSVVFAVKMFQNGGSMAKILSALAWETRQAGKFPSIYLEQQFLSMPQQRFFQSSLLCSSQKYQNGGADGKKLACSCLGGETGRQIPLF
jgi:hypothetical protein